MPKLFDCEECGAAIETDEEYVEVDTHFRNPGGPPRVLRIHTYLCLPASNVMHSGDARSKEAK
jgi:hypothetical protein